MDPLDSAFSAMRVHDAKYARLEATAPWGLVTRKGDDTARFGLVVRGSALLTVDEVPDLQHPVALAAGDCFVIPHGRSYTLRDHPQSPTINCVEVVRSAAGGVVSLGGGGAATSIVSGWFRFDPQGAQPLLNLLPPLLHVRMDDERTRLLQVALELLSLETAERRPGAALVVSRLADIVFVHAVREHIARLDGQHGRGWLAALADRRIGTALRLMHADVARSWSLEALAGAVGMSRSAFAQHFRDKVGLSPIEYLTQWRMFRAGHLLRTTQLPLASLAAQVGYESEASFNKAFKRATGHAPGRYRRNASGGMVATDQLA
jgi:AraC-like DNA-binding protein